MGDGVIPPQHQIIVGEAWERQPKETSGAWAAFVAYRNLGGSRTLNRAATAIGKTRQHLETWSTRWAWVRRCEEWDREQDRVWHDEMRKARREMARRHAKQAEMLQAVALRTLRAKYGDNLELVTAESLEASEILRYFVEAAKIERVALGEPESIVENQINGGPVESDRNLKPLVPITFGGRVEETLALLEAARARTVDGVARASD